MVFSSSESFDWKYFITQYFAKRIQIIPLAKRTYEGILPSLMMFVCQTLHDSNNFAMFNFYLNF